MLKQSPSKNLRGAGRGCKVKHVAQMCLILAVSLWMLYQLRHCYFKKAAVEETGMKAGGDNVIGRLGRKGILPGIVVEEEERGDAFEQVDDLEESDEQEMDDRDQDTQVEEVEA